ncbi:Response regulator MprA [Rosistilla oblonga]|uniref:Response regulator MprA n=2 Tax=Rosistilla TaxID=2795779 RepID=A0A518IWH3_9BACT|nr:MULTISPECIES: response regulator [Rosistilla]QDS90286.1 Response regulator MprA [Rosistilla ulvae]QDV14422.1 Response regulator MprA [Rosistilla oblonga]QDV57442.1 Response regulator MprA [Rosistilla oblonga]
MKLTKPNLLITDDDRAFRETLRSVLDRFDFEMYLAEDGEEALEIISRHQVHLALFDVHMPRLSGLEALTRMRASGLSLPCILMSAALDEAICDAASKLEDVSVIPKPLKIREISSVVTHLLAKRYGWQAESPAVDRPE